MPCLYYVFAFTYYSTTTNKTNLIDVRKLHYVAMINIHDASILNLYEREDDRFSFTSDIEK